MGAPIESRAWVWKSTTLHVDCFFLDWIMNCRIFPIYRIAILGACSPFEDMVMSLLSFYWLQRLPFDFQIFSWPFPTKKHSSSPFAWLKSWKPEGFLSFWEIRTLDDWKFITPGILICLFLFCLLCSFKLIYIYVYCNILYVCVMVSKPSRGGFFLGFWVRWRSGRGTTRRHCEPTLGTNRHAVDRLELVDNSHVMFRPD